MKKVSRIVCIAVMLLLSLSLFACQSVNISAGIELARHKADAKSALEVYAEEKGEDNYTVENWTEIGEFVTQGKTAIDAAKNETDVDAAADAAKQAIDMVTQKELLGSFFSLQEAYEEGLVTKDDIMHMVYFMHGVRGTIYEYEIDKGEVWIEQEWVEIDFMPQINKPAFSELSQEVIANMKEAFYEKNKQALDNAIGYYADKKINVLDTISITSFLGKYNGCYAVQATTSLVSYGLGSYTVVVDNIVWMQLAPSIIIYTPANKLFEGEIT